VTPYLQQRRPELLKAYRDGCPTSKLKGNMWKGPFPMPRQKLACWQLLEGLS
jgi:hypothetical protein